MVLSEDHSNATYQIRSVSAGKIVINNETYTTSVIISPEKLIAPWRPTTVDALTETDLQLLLTSKPEIILLGTGQHSTILPAKKLACLFEKNYHVECMNTAAACRTYTLLIAEGRQVVAGLLL